ncbi:MAG TPA: NDP-sugar synthase [Blastocatellia bacterium]|jgi:NDP-sugar pyrophosphorylase family protein|nr:NDP-sugar synthase [Blastocatellia bacterium]
MKAVILAAGFGTRLWPLTEDRTKPAIPFLNRPLIAYSVEYLARFGIRDIIINLHHQPDSIRRALGDGSGLGVNIRYSYEEEILGTSGALDRVRDCLGDDDFVVINGKIVTTIDLGAAIRAHKNRGAIATLILKENAAREHFSIVEIDQNFRITRFAGFPEAIATDAFTAEANSPGSGGGLAKVEGAPLMFTGIQVLSPRILDYVPRDCFSHSTIHVYPVAMEKGEAVLAHVCDGDWYEMSTLDRYFEASLLFMRKQGRRLISGVNCAVEEGAMVEESVLWDNVTVERGARVRYCVLADGVRIPAGASLERAVVVRRDIVGEVERGEVVGENVIVSL